MSFLPPAQFAVGTYTSSLAIKVCIDAACQHELADSPIQVPLTYSITPSEGHDYTRNVVGVVARDLAWSEPHQLIYAVVSASSAHYANTLVAIDPHTAAISGSVALAGNPQVVSLSDDGAYAYVGFSDANVVQRISLGTLASDSIISLGTDSSGSPRYAGVVKAQPGEPHSFAVSEYVLDQYGYQTVAGVVLFDDSVARPTTFNALNGARRDSIVWNADGSALYVEDSANYGLFTLAVSPAGLTQSNVAAAIIIFSDILCVNQTIYGAARIADPAAGTMQSLITPDFPSGIPFALDAAAHRAYYVYDDDSGSAPIWTLATYDLRAQTILVKARLGASGEYAQVIHWGVQGVARSTTQGIDIFDGAWLASSP